MEEKAEDPGGMEPAEHDLLADLRRARRSLRLQDMDEPPAVARLTPGQRIADAVATVMGSWSFIIVQSAILFVWITANLVGAIRGLDYIRHLVLPDFFFHISIAHAILRHLGAKIGKRDYLGNLTQQSGGDGTRRASMAPGEWNGNDNDRAFPMVGVPA